MTEQQHTEFDLKLGYVLKKFKSDNETVKGPEKTIFLHGYCQETNQTFASAMKILSCDMLYLN